MSSTPLSHDRVVVIGRCGDSYRNASEPDDEGRREQPSGRVHADTVTKPPRRKADQLPDLAANGTRSAWTASYLLSG